jgi:AcrR family transcriptional regulator
VIVMAERDISTGQSARGTDGAGETADARLLPVATRLFAELGYDAVSTQMIADAAGTAPATINDLHGGKSGLYKDVIVWATEGWAEQQKAGAEEHTPDADGLIRMMDRYLEYCLQHPELARLWGHRWMDDASDIPGLEERFSGPLQQQAVELVRSSVSPDIDPQVALWTLTWTIHGYLQSGLPTPSGQRMPPDDPQTLRRFRRNLHQIIRLMAASD